MMKFITPQGKQTILFESSLKPSLLAGYDRVMVVVDKRVQNNSRTKKLIIDIKSLNFEFRVLVIDINNFSKNTVLMSEVLDEMASFSMTRKSLVVSIGGGSICDLIGVCASIFMRGIDYATVPTTFISMADGIISKVAINHGNSKNMVGAFKSPKWVLIDTNYVDADDSTKIAQGLVEVWKHAILEQDDDILKEIRRILENNRADQDELMAIVKWSMLTKSKYVLDDWDDKNGIHKALSLGHTLANIIEMKLPVHHAEAVFYGIIFECILARRLGILSQDRFEETLSYSQIFESKFNSLNQIKQILRSSDILVDLRKDKISQHNQVIFVLPTDEGYAIKPVDDDLVLDVLGKFTELDLFGKFNEIPSPENTNYRDSHLSRKVSPAL